MNKRGTSELYLLIIQILVIGIVIAFMIKKASSIDIDFIRRTSSVQNLGLIMSAISFLPGNVNYTYLTEENKNMYSWPEFFIYPSASEIIYSEKPITDLSTADRYSFFVNKKNYGIPNDETKIQGKSLEIRKSDKIEMKKAVSSNLKKLECAQTDVKYPVRPDKGGVKGIFYDKYGAEMAGEVKEDYINFEKQFFINDKRVYPADNGLVKENLNEAEIMLKIAQVVNPEETNSFIARENLEEKHILLTAGNYTEENSFIIFYIPVNSYDIDYNVSCNILNKILYIDDSLLQASITGVLIMPYDGTHIIMEIGNINNPVLLTGNKPSLIGEALK